MTKEKANQRISRMKQYLLVAWLLLVLAGVMLYLIWIRDWVELMWYGQAPSWFARWVTTIYPRFPVEKHRFDLAFFLGKADQVVIRFTLVSIVFLGIELLKSRRREFQTRMAKIANPTIPVTRVNWMISIFYAGVIFFTWEWFLYLQQLYRAQAFYKPLLLLRVLHLDFPVPEVSAALCGILLVSAATAVFRLKTVLSATLAAILLVLLQAWLYSFEKMDHTFAPLTYAAMLMPFLMREWNRNRQSEPVPVSLAGWPLFLIQLSIGLIYLQAGLEKLLIAGFDWLSPQTFRNYIYLHQAPLGMWVAQSDFLCLFFPLLALLFQLGFIGVVFFPRLRWVMLPAGFLFHASTYLLLGVGWYFNAWVFTYLFFVDWETVEGWVRK